MPFNLPTPQSYLSKPIGFEYTFYNRVCVYIYDLFTCFKSCLFQCNRSGQTWGYSVSSWPVSGWWVISHCIPFDLLYSVIFVYFNTRDQRIQSAFYSVAVSDHWKKQSALGSEVMDKTCQFTYNLRQSHFYGIYSIDAPFLFYQGVSGVSTICICIMVIFMRLKSTSESLTFSNKSILNFHLCRGDCF